MSDIKVNIYRKRFKWTAELDGRVIARARTMRQLQGMIEITDTLHNWNDLRGML